MFLSYNAESPRQSNVSLCCIEHVKCMGDRARSLLTSPNAASPPLWLCYSCKPCSVCLVSGRTRKLRLVRMFSAHCHWWREFFKICFNWWC